MLVNDRKNRFSWLIKLRLMACLVQLPLTIVGRYYGYLTQSTQLIFSLVLISYLIYNTHLLKQNSDKEISLNRLSFEAVLDLSIFSLLLLLSGGINNPFVSFYFVLALLAGFFTTKKTAPIYLGFLLGEMALIQLWPGHMSLTAIISVLNAKTIPYLLVQLGFPLMAYSISLSFGQALDRSNEKIMNLAIQTERQNRLKALGSLSAGFSHEFASPLQNIKLRLKRLAKGLPPNQADLVECEQSLNDCQEVLYRMNKGQLDFETTEIETINIAQLTEEISHEWKLDHPAVQLELILEVALTKINQLNFVQALINLLDNAAEANNHQGKISVRLKTQNEKTLLSVKDSGPGFSPTMLGDAGKPFVTTKSQGTGLGLYSTQLFMSSLGGELLIKNDSTQGAIVTLVFPQGPHL